MLSTGLNTTISLLTQSHTTFLGPKIPHGLDEENGAGCEEGIEAVLKTLGYRLRVEQASYMAPQPDREGSLTLTWTNDGVAPMYWDWPVYLYFLDGEQQLLGKYPVELETHRATSRGKAGNRDEPFAESPDGKGGVSLCGDRRSPDGKAGGIAGDEYRGNRQNGGTVSLGIGGPDK